MKKPWLLIAGDNYYPSTGSNDWIGCYETFELANSRVTREPIPLEVFERGPRKGQVKPGQIESYNYRIGERLYDWVQIVNLEVWAG